MDSPVSTLVSVIIPTFNKSKYLELSLASWCHQHFNGYELVIVDDGSTDSTSQVLRKYAHRLPLSWVRTENNGRAAARNCGLAAASGSIIVFVDDDRVVPPDFLQWHVRALEDTSGRSLIVGWQLGLLVELPSAGDQLVPVRLIQYLLTQRPQFAQPLLDIDVLQTLTSDDLECGASCIADLQLCDPWEEHLGQVISEYGPDITDCPLAWACGTTGNLSVYREWLERVGGFDEAFKGWGVEDTELHYRLAMAGVRTRIEKRAVNYHQNHPKNGRLRGASWLINAGHFLAKHETLEVALYVQADVSRIPLLQACRLLTEARRSADRGSSQLYRKLVIDGARRLVACSDAD
jgi:glycosyltransferase involved in cell wall biosynthesis